jgi:hypothetical protein
MAASAASSRGMERIVLSKNLRKHRPDGTLQVSIETLSQSIIKLNDRILYDQSWRGVTDTTKAASEMADPRKTLELLDPVQRALGGTILSSGLIEAPAKLQAAMAQNPTDIFDNVTPLNWAKPQTNPELTPILFTSEGVRYVGWLRRGLLPFVLNCELHEFGSLRQGSQTVPPTAPIVIESVTIPAVMLGSRAAFRQTSAEPEALSTVENTLNRQLVSVVVLLFVMVFLFAIFDVKVEPIKSR